MDKNKIIEGLYLEHKDHIYNFLSRLANDPELALDITQQTFIKALSDKNFHQVANPKAYLFTIARNTLFNEFKRKKASSLDAIEEAGNFETADETEDLHEAAELTDIQEKVEKTIKRMPVKSRELMILRYTEDLTVKEICAITGRSLSDIKVSLHRSKIKFESAFTSEMYAKVAVSRDQCDTLSGMLAPYIDSEIPERDLQKVDKHITHCKICYEDAEQLKRSRTLFNLATLMSLPYIFDQMMGDAMASEFEFLGNAGKAADSSSASGAVQKTKTDTSVAEKPTDKTSVTSHTTQKIISSKVAAGISAVVIIAGGITLNTWLNDDEILPPVNPLTSSPVSSPTGNRAPLPAGMTSKVNFSATDANTATIIHDGLQWHIIKVADDAGNNMSEAEQLVENSHSATLNLALDSGYYVAKVTYKGETVESEFNVNNNNPLNIKLNFSTAATPDNSDIANLPDIHIRRLQTGTQEAKGLKMQRDLCISIIESYKQTRSTYPQLWQDQEKELLEDNPEFNLDRGIAPEPDWSNLTENYEDEYFSGERYALYQTQSYYELSEDGSCKLNKTTQHTAEIDDGKFSYYIDFVQKSAEKNISQTILEKNVQVMYQNVAKDNPFLTAAMGKMMTEAMLGEAGSELEKQSREALKQLEDLNKIAGTESIAGETCEYTFLGKQSGVRICYWKTMHQYPSTVKRDIILGTNVNLNPSEDSLFLGQTTSKAVVFEKNITLNDVVFSVPSDIKVISRDYE